MKPSTIDPTRQGGTDMAPRSLAAPEMTLEEAVEYDEKFAWRSLPTRSDRARQAILAEVARLNTTNDAMASLLRDQGCRNLDLVDELARFRAALPDVIGCHWGRVPHCEFAAQGAVSPCCVSLRRACGAGLLPQPERQDEPGDGA